MERVGLDLLIIGAGPVGLTAALEAKRHGLTVRIVDQKPARSTIGSRAMVVHSRVMELLEPNGSVVKKIREANSPVRQMKIHFDSDRNIMSQNWETVNWGDTKFPGMASLPQYDTERILEEEIVTTGGTIEYGVSIDHLSQNQHGVSTTLKHVADGKLETVTSTFVLAADGGRSQTREMIGVNMHRSRSKIYFIVADLSFQGANPIGSAKEMHIFPEGAGGFAFFFPLPKHNSFRVMFQTPKGMTNKSDVALDKHFFESTLLEYLGKEFEVKLVGWQSIFEITHGISETYRQGRVFLAGDAAHVHSPVRGQGMNYGMQDACNLIWKLAWVKRATDRAGTAAIADSSTDLILQSYHEERHTTGNELVQNVGMVTWIITTRNPFVQMIRNTLMRWVFSAPDGDNVRRMGQLELKYSHTPSRILVRHSNHHASFFSRVWGWIFGSNKKKNYICQPGERLPNLKLSTGLKLHELVDRRRHTVLLLNLDAPQRSPGKDTMNMVGSVTPADTFQQVSEPPISGAALTTPQVVLVRPDLYVAAVGATMDELLWRLRETWDETMVTTM